MDIELQIKAFCDSWPNDSVQAIVYRNGLVKDISEWPSSPGRDRGTEVVRFCVGGDRVELTALRPNGLHCGGDECFHSLDKLMVQLHDPSWG